jgi:predicted enzyme related to lactoylglutathione lyase
MKPRESYPPGVPCFIDTERADVDAAAAFYGGLFGWTFDDRLPPGAPERFLMAKLDGLAVAGIASASSPDSRPDWNTYVSVASADEASEKVRAAGGTLLLGPLDVADAGRMAVFADPQGAALRVWEPRRTHGAQVVNAPGSWNFSNLESGDVAAAKRFYSAVFGWKFSDGEGEASMITVPGYGEHLEALTPGTLKGYEELGAPQGFGDAIGWLQPPSSEHGGSRWAVTFSVGDADETAHRAAELGGKVLVEPFDVPWVRMAVLSDPDGATFTIGKFMPPEN